MPLVDNLPTNLDIGPATRPLSPGDGLEPPAPLTPLRTVNRSRAIHFPPGIKKGIGGDRRSLSV